MSESRWLLLFGLVNLSLLGFLTPLLDGAALAAQDPLFFSWPGVLVIGLWGLAYMAVAPIWRMAPWLLLVFALEKAFFAGRWLLWLSEHHAGMSALFEKAPTVAMFYAGYGAWDGFCALMFLLFCLRARRLQGGMSAA